MEQVPPTGGEEELQKPCVQSSIRDVMPQVARKVYEQGSFTLKRPPGNYVSIVEGALKDYTFLLYHITTMIPHTPHCMQEDNFNSSLHSPYQIPILAANIKASRFVEEAEVRKAFRAQAGKELIATQLCINRIKVAEFRVASSSKLVTMVSCIWCPTSLDKH